MSSFKKSKTNQFNKAKAKKNASLKWNKTQLEKRNSIKLTHKCPKNKIL